MSAINSTEVRTDQLMKYLYQLKARYGYQKFNLIGHSHGGLNARHVASIAPEIVASVTNVATPNLGSFPSTFEYNNPWTRKFDRLQELIASISGRMDGNHFPQNRAAYIYSTSKKGVEAFNRRHPMGMPRSYCGQGPSSVNGIRLYSFSGAKVVTNWRDPSDWLLLFQSWLTNKQSDGWIERCSTHFGYVLRDNFRWNHLDEINHIYGKVGSRENPVSVYRAHANRLRNVGL
jgi:triacylglycerol lipase